MLFGRFWLAFRCLGVIKYATNKVSNGMKKTSELEVISVLKISLKMIKELSFELCEHKDDLVEDNNRHINNLAHESLKLLERRESTAQRIKSLQE